jgi:hypothetical protein
MRQVKSIASIALIASLPFNSVVWPLTSEQGKSQRNDQSELTTICDHHMAAGPLSLGADPLSLIQFQGVPQEAKREAEKSRRATVSTYYQLPTKASDIPLIFGATKSASAADQREIAEVKARLSSLGIADANREMTADSFEETIKKSPSDFIILVGHNYEGQFAFLDGHGEDLADLANSCAKSGKICIFVTCRSKEWIPPADAHGVSYEITYNEGIYMASEIAAFLGRQAKGATSAKAVDSYIEGLERHAHFKFQVKYMILKGCAGAVALVILAIIVGNLDCALDPHCPQRRHVNH